MNSYAQNDEPLLAHNYPEFNNVVFNTAAVGKEGRSFDDCYRTPAVVGGVITGIGIMVASLYIARRVVGSATTDDYPLLIIGGATVGIGLGVRILGKSACEKNKSANSTAYGMNNKRSSQLLLATNGNTVGFHFNF